MPLPPHCPLCLGLNGGHTYNCPERQDSNVKYIVDLPDIHKNNAWVHVAAFTTKEAALEWIRKNLGDCDEEGRLSILAEIEY